MYYEYIISLFITSFPECFSSQSLQAWVRKGYSFFINITLCFTLLMLYHFCVWSPVFRKKKEKKNEDQWKPEQDEEAKWNDL